MPRRPAMFYEVRVEGILDERWSAWFDGLKIGTEGDDVTVIAGAVVDQAALHGLLARVHDLGLQLISVHRRLRMDAKSGHGVEVREVADGLWLWRQRHWEWRDGDDWEPEVSSWVVESRGEVVLLDPLAPPPSASEVWTRLEAKRPTAVVILKPDHVRDVDLFVHWYDAAPHGPWLFWRGDAPRTELKPVRAGDKLPGGLRALDDGRGMMETPVYLPEQRAIVFADGMTAPGGVLRVWWSQLLEERTLPALRAMLDLPFEHVLVSHGEPVHDRAEFEAALKREPWSRRTGSHAVPASP